MNKFLLKVNNDMLKMKTVLWRVDNYTLIMDMVLLRRNHGTCAYICAAVLLHRYRWLCCQISMCFFIIFIQVPLHRILMTGLILMRRQTCSTSTKASVHTRETIFMDVYFTLTFFQLVWKGNVYASCRNQLWTGGFFVNWRSGNEWKNKMFRSVLNFWYNFIGFSKK